MPSTRTKFYNIFWDNEQCQDIFLLHKESLLEKKEVDLVNSSKSYYLQRFVISNTLKRNDSLLRIEGRIKNRNIDLNHSLERKSNSNINEQQIQTYINKRFGKPIDSIAKKINGGSFSKIKFISEVTTSIMSEKRLLKFLHKYGFVSVSIKSFEELKKSVEAVFDSEVSRLLNSEHLVDLFAALDEVASYYDNENFNGLIESNKFYVDTIYDKENFKDRLDLFDLLYEAGILIGGVFKAYYECTNCSSDIFSGSVRLNVTPSKVKLKCPNCAKEVFYLAPYKIEESVFADIKSKDGLLHAAVVALLSENSIVYRTNIMEGSDIEIDIQLLNKEANTITDIVEVKMFKTDRTDDVILTNLKEGLRAFLKARDKLISINIGYSNLTYHYLTNIVDEEMLMDLRNSFRGEISSRNIIVHDTFSFKDYCDELYHNYR